MTAAHPEPTRDDGPTPEEEAFFTRRFADTRELLQAWFDLRGLDVLVLPAAITEAGAAND